MGLPCCFAGAAQSQTAGELARSTLALAFAECPLALGDQEAFIDRIKTHDMYAETLIIRSDPANYVEANGELDEHTFITSAWSDYIGHTERHCVVGVNVGAAYPEKVLFDALQSELPQWTNARFSGGLFTNEPDREEDRYYTHGLFSDQVVFGDGPMLFTELRSVLDGYEFHFTSLIAQQEAAQ